VIRGERLAKGDCACGCGGGLGLRPLYQKDNPTELRLDPENGRPVLRYTIVCRHDLKAVEGSAFAQAADSAWKADWKKKRDEERAKE